MSREDVARAALRSLASPAMKVADDGRFEHDAFLHGHRQYSDSAADGPQRSTSHGGSFFSVGAPSQITDSPTTSPSLAAYQSPPTSYHDPFGAPSAPNSAASTRPFYTQRSLARYRDGSTGTPSEVPSLSLSNSSVSDSYLLSPYHEAPLPPSQTTSMSSVRTVRPSPSSNASLHQTGPKQSSSAVQWRSEAVQRAAAALRITVEDVRRGMEIMGSMRHADDAASAAELQIDDADRDTLQRIADTVRSEEERLAQIASFRAAYMHAESMRSDMELHHQHPSAASQSSQRTTPSLPSTSPSRRRAQRNGVIGPPTSSRTMPPLSPPPSYERLEMLEQDESATLSPREALELLADAQDHPRRSSGASHSPHPGLTLADPSVQTHVRRPSGTRPLSLPDRSYRSMDDYVANSVASSSTLRASGGLSHLRRSVQAAPYPRPSLSRGASRSPLFPESPYPLSAPHDGASDVGSSPLFAPTSRLAPAASRRRSGSNTSNRSSNVSRRASADVLGLGIPRSASPFGIQDAPSSSSLSSSSKLTHEEVMARLQRKVRDRIAAREASGSLEVPDSASAASLPTSPAGTTSALAGSNSGHTTGSLGRRRQNSSSSNAPPSAHRSSSNSRNRKPRKASSLRILPQSSGSGGGGGGGGMGIFDAYDKPLPALPGGVVSGSPPSSSLPSSTSVSRATESRGAGEEDDEDRMSGVEDNSGRLGIEALLSAAAIADSPRKPAH